jgi:uncharacterized protein
MSTTEIGNLVLYILILVTMLVGLFGLLIPIIPGITIIWVAALAYGLIAGFNLAGGIVFGVITVLMIVGNFADNLLMGASARKTGASWISILVALVAGIVGTFVLPPVGGLLFALVGIFIVEYIRVRDWKKALESLRGMATGCGWSVAARFIIGLMMIAWWLIWAFVVPIYFP